MDIIVISGNNDIPNLDFDKLVQNIVLFKKNVLEQNPANTFTIARFMRPPKLAWFPCNGPEPTPHYGRYINHLEKINNVNAAIDLINQQNGHVGTLGFQNEGTRGHSKTSPEGIRTTKYKHMFNQWREDRNEQKLHLVEDKRAAMFNKVVKFIECNIRQKI